MEWPKLKNIILVILLITNLFLLGLVGLREWNTSRYHQQARENAIQVLSQNGIHMDLTSLPEDLILPTATVSREREKEAELLAPLLGSVNEKNEGGGRYHYTGDSGECWFLSRGEFSVRFNENTYPLSESAGKSAIEALALIGFHGVDLLSKEQGNVHTVTLLQLWNDVPVRTCQVEVTFLNGSLQSMTGTRLSGSPSPSGDVELSAVTGLLRFLEHISERGDVCSRIDIMRAEYQYSTSLTETSLLLPVWYFETDAGSYTLDMTSNQLKKL